jgi:hypothetical protein
MRTDERTTHHCAFILYKDLTVLLHRIYEFPRMLKAVLLCGVMGA